MPRNSKTINVYLEIGKKRTFAGAMDWPGWCRSGRDEGSALQALCDYGPRYARVLRSARLGFQAPAETSAFTVVERLDGNATTDFGAPDRAPSGDARGMDEAELRRCQALLRACWRAFDSAVRAASGKELSKGPRGGGRDVDRIIQHVLGGDAGYLSRLAWKLGRGDEADLSRTRRAILEALAAAAAGEVAPLGPRGGVRWTPRYFVRRVAWHVLDHTWEIEDRIQ
jgi:hypothetical protein